MENNRGLKKGLPAIRISRMIICKAVAIARIKLNELGDDGVCCVLIKRIIKLN